MGKSVRSAVGLGSFKIAGVNVASGIGLDSVAASRRRGAETQEYLHDLGGFSVGETEKRVGIGCTEGEGKRQPG